ncbi:cell wall glycosyl hydrolase [Zalerion maritima]|uniref:Mannan endo-1,6-alpha-mannosidase n=1 Tax=Zalerion maritima TaxID=339359 RepID=A0AAD5RQ34_9PEZI|nr:cell wall glycosyl hydrolase [Zalerion maritima]
MRTFLRTAGLACLLSSTTAIELDLNSDKSVRDAASTIAFGLLKYYTGNNTGDVPGNLPDPYFWWEAGAMFGTMVDYWHMTGDSTYNEVTTQALLHQTGNDDDYMPKNQTRTLGNDDQGFWAMAAMSAAENVFPDPPEDEPQWLAIAQAVFNEYTWRWDAATCGGGLRWQIFQFNNGFNYKNSISNGCFFNIASRLARFTGNETYAEWAERVWEWEMSIDLITEDGKVYDGASVDPPNTNCQNHDTIQWTYNAGIFLHGAAVMYNITDGDEKWKKRLDSLLAETMDHFYKDDILFEFACEEVELCNIDQSSFKGYLTRWLAGVTQAAPYTKDTVFPRLQSSAQAAAKACSGSPDTGFNGIAGTACGFKWTTGGFDGNVGVGQQMNALSAVMYTLVDKRAIPATEDTGGTSKGNVNAGRINDDKLPTPKPITTADKVAAGFLTTAILMSVVGGSIVVVR